MYGEGENAGKTAQAPTASATEPAPGTTSEGAKDALAALAVASEGPSSTSKAPERQPGLTSERETKVPAAVEQNKKDEVALPVREKGRPIPSHQLGLSTDKNPNIEKSATAPGTESSRNAAAASDKATTTASTKKATTKEHEQAKRTETTKISEQPKTTDIKDTKATGESSKPAPSQVEPTAKDDAALKAGAAATAAGAAGTAAYVAAKKDETRREPGMDLALDFSFSS